MLLGKDLEEIPTLRASKLRLFTILEDDSADIRDVERIIESDPAMAAKVVRIANSAFYRCMKNVRGIHDAIAVIGFDMVRCITLSMSVMQAFGSNEAVAENLWKHSFGVALSATSIARDQNEKGSLFSGGLLHDLGRVVLVWKEPEHYLPMFEGGWPDIAQEQEVFDIDHAQIGEIVGQRWHFHPEVTDIIRNHHAPVSYLSGVICLADTIAHAVERGQDVDLSRVGPLVEPYVGPAVEALSLRLKDAMGQSRETIEGLM